MARIPSVTDSGFQPVLADTRVLTPARADTSVDSPSMAAIPGQQMEQAGRAMVGASDAMLQIQTRMQNDANQVRVDDALNQARQKALDLTYDPQQGYLAQKGNAALQRDSGMPLPDEYGQKLSEAVGDLSENLGNDEQRRLFAMRANDVMTSFKGGVEQHTMQEFKNYSLSVQDGAIKLGADDAKRNWSDPVKIDTALASVKAAVVRASQLQGEAANTTLAKMMAATSMVHTGVIDAALQTNNPTYASMYLQQNKDAMTADDILKVNGSLNHVLDGQVAMHAVKITSDNLAGQIQPTNMDRLNGIVLGAESGGKDFNADGTPTTSPKGAKYGMQVMPDTAANPGYGITPAQADTPAEYNRVGTQYLQAMVQKYGNPAMAMAAYNAGPGALDDAQQKAKDAGTPQAWLSYLPKETQSYVNANMTKLSAGLGAPSFPTESQFVQSAIATLGDNPRIQQVQMTRKQAVAQYTMLNKSRLEMGDQAVQRAQQALVQNGGNFASLDPQVKADVVRLAPDKYDNLQDYAGKIANPVRADNLAAYNQAVSHPDELAKMSDSTFQSFIQQNFTQRTARQIVTERDNQINGKTDTSSNAINSPALNTALNSRLTSIGINPTPKPTDMAARAQVGTIQKYVRDDIFAMQAQTGQKMTPAEINQRVDTLFAKDLNFQRTFMGVGIGGTSQNMLQMKIGDIPSASLDSLRQSFAGRGVKTPTDDQLMRAYWTLKGRSG